MYILYMHSYVAQIAFRHKGIFPILLIHTAYVRIFDNTNTSTISPTLTSSPPPPDAPPQLFHTLVPSWANLSHWRKVWPPSWRTNRTTSTSQSCTRYAWAQGYWFVQFGCVSTYVYCVKKKRKTTKNKLCTYVRVHVRTYHTCACWHVWMDRYHK